MAARKESPVCGRCGEDRDMHGHDFETVFVPATCVCDPLEWPEPTKVPDPCAAFVDDPTSPGRCATCQHDSDCHPKGG